MATKKRHRAIAAFFAGLFLLTSSALTITVIYTMLDENKKNQANQQEANQEKSMEDMLQGKPLAGFTPVPKVEELQKIDLKEGSGAEVGNGATVTVDYTGAIAKTGLVFESSKDSGQPVPLSLNQVIEGWKQGIPGMKEGGTRRLLIPSELAYGSQGAGSIPADADLVFDVTVHKVDK